MDECKTYRERIGNELFEASYDWGNLKMYTEVTYYKQELMVGDEVNEYVADKKTFGSCLLFNDLLYFWINVEYGEFASTPVPKRYFDVADCFGLLDCRVVDYSPYNTSSFTKSLITYISSYLHTSSYGVVGLNIDGVEFLYDGFNPDGKNVSEGSSITIADNAIMFHTESGCFGFRSSSIRNYSIRYIEDLEELKGLDRYDEIKSKEEEKKSEKREG